MKQAYMKELRELLMLYNMDDAERNDILLDYEDMYDNYTDYGMSDEDIKEKLGQPDLIIKELTEGYDKITEIKRKTKASRSNKMVALSPFIALILFFVLGFVFEMWVYSWTVFLLIPVIAIITNVEGGEKIIALTPFIAVVAYTVMGFGYNLWHPGWLIFLIIPVTAILIKGWKEGIIQLLTALSPFITLTIFFLYILPNDMVVPGWIVFLIIPIIGVLNEKNAAKIVLVESLIIGGAGLYVYIGETTGYYDYALLAFIPLTLYLILQTNLSFFKIPKGYRWIIVASILAFVGLGLLSDVIQYNLWGVAWLVFLSIPIYAIIREVPTRERLVSLSPFIALILFFTSGYFFDLWQFSWMAFLLIPITAIIKEA